MHWPYGTESNTGASKQHCVCSIRAPGIPALGVRVVADCPGFASEATKGAYYLWNHRQCSGDP